MATQDVNEMIRAEMKRDPALYRETFKEAIEVFLGGEVDVAKTLLRNDVLARLGFHKLAELTGKSPKNLMRMLSRTGNPQAHNLSEIIRALQAFEGVTVEVRFKKAAA
jgi:DNA-binding phage protein